MKIGGPTTDRIQTFVEEALRWLPSESEDGVDAPSSTILLPTYGPRPSVLFVEDNADMREYVRGLLKEDYDVTVAPNGQAALDAMRQLRPDLVLADVMMPILDGFELLRAIRANPALRDIPVILLSARAGEEDQIAGLDTGADDYVTKPFSAQELRARVRAHLSLARRRREVVLAMVENDEKLRHWNADLEARIQAEVQMNKSVMKQLAKVEKTAALGRLAGGMAHDFNNILQIVSGYASLIQLKSLDPAAVQRMATVVEEAARRGHSVTQRLLIFARQDGLNPEALDLPALLGRLREVLTHTLGEHVTLALDLVEGLPSVLVDQSRLETVLVNLANNASDAMPDGGTITFSARADKLTDTAVEHGLSPGVYVRLSVEDAGEGMDATTLARVTEPFFTTKPVGRGTGLGLAMASSFAEQSGGALTIVSDLGRGTTVTLLLPSTDLRTATSPASRDEPGDRGDMRTSRILVVDDETFVRHVISDLLECAGYDVLQADGAAAALELLTAGEKIDLLLSDLSMPGLDGISLIRAAQSQRPALPAILLTGCAGDAPFLALGGSFSLLHKPIDGHQLISQVASLLRVAEVASVSGSPMASVGAAASGVGIEMPC